MTVPLIVEIIFRFIPSALLVFGFIEINLTAKYNKYIQFIAMNTVYLFAGLFGQYMREKYKLEFFDFVLAVALVLIYSIFFHTDAVGYRIFIGTLVYLSLIIFDTITTAVIFVIFPEFSFDIGHLTYPALLFADIDLIIYGILMYFEHCIIKRIHDRKSINKRAVIFMFFPESQVLILCVIMKLIMANTDNATPEIMYFTLICVVICVISDILCYRAPHFGNRRGGAETGAAHCRAGLGVHPPRCGNGRAPVYRRRTHRRLRQHRCRYRAHLRRLGPLAARRDPRGYPRRGRPRGARHRRGHARPQRRHHALRHALARHLRPARAHAHHQPARLHQGGHRELGGHRGGAAPRREDDGRRGPQHAEGPLGETRRRGSSGRARVRQRARKGLWLRSRDGELAADALAVWLSGTGFSWSEVFVPCQKSAFPCVGSALYFTGNVF